MDEICGEWNELNHMVHGTKFGKGLTVRWSVLFVSGNFWGSERINSNYKRVVWEISVKKVDKNRIS